MIVLSRNNLISLLKMNDVMNVIETAFNELAQGSASIPPRTIINIEKENGSMLFMPSYLNKSGSLAIKSAGMYKENPKKYNLPTIMASLILLDHKTGEPLCLMDGSYITAIRTAAASGLAAKYLAREDSTTIGIIGAGVQAETQVLAMMQIRPIKRILVYDIISDKIKSFISSLSEKVSCGFEAVKNPDNLLEKSDIVITSTTSKTPVFTGTKLKPGTHISSIGWVGTNGRELDTYTVEKCKLVVDTMDGVLSESGDILIPIKEGKITKDHIWCELKDLTSGAKKGRTSNKELTLWKSVGLAIEDAATAQLAYQKAHEFGIGTPIHLYE